MAGNTKKIDRMTFFLIPIGVAINFAGWQLFITLMKLPLSMDSIGTIIVGVLCGPIAGGIVGLLTNLVNCISSPMTIFWAWVSVAFGVLAGFLGNKGAFDKLKRAIICSPLFALIGGCCGTLTTYLVYGLDFDTSTEALLVGIPLYEMGVPKWLSILAMRLASDIPDKLLCCILAYLILIALPSRYLIKLPRGERFIKRNKKEEKSTE